MTAPNYQRIPWQYLMWFKININEDWKNLLIERLVTKAPKILFVALNIKLSTITLSSIWPIQLLDLPLKFDFNQQNWFVQIIPNYIDLIDSLNLNSNFLFALSFLCLLNSYEMISKKVWIHLINFHHCDSFGLHPMLASILNSFDLWTKYILTASC